MSTPVRRAIYGKLAGDTTLNNLLGPPAPNYSKSIYYRMAPSGASFPFVLMSKQDGRPTETFGDPSAFETDNWLIKGVDRGLSADTAEAIQARLAALLNDATLSISGAALMYLRRRSDVDYPEFPDVEVEEGVRYIHAGSLYRLVYD